MDRVYVDEETGESIGLPDSDCEIRRLIGLINNVETGEPEINVVGIETTKSRRTRFQVMISNGHHEVYTLFLFLFSSFYLFFLRSDSNETVMSRNVCNGYII